MNRRTIVMLLQHGPLSTGEVHEIVGACAYHQVSYLLRQMYQEGALVKRFGKYSVLESM